MPPRLKLLPRIMANRRRKRVTGTASASPPALSGTGNSRLLSATEMCRLLIALIVLSGPALASPNTPKQPPQPPSKPNAQNAALHISIAEWSPDQSRLSASSAFLRIKIVLQNLSDISQTVRRNQLVLFNDENIVPQALWAPSGPAQQSPENAPPPDDPRPLVTLEPKSSQEITLQARVPLQGRFEDLKLAIVPKMPTAPESTETLAETSLPPRKLVRLSGRYGPRRQIAVLQLAAAPDPVALWEFLPELNKLSEQGTKVLVLAFPDSESSRIQAATFDSLMQLVTKNEGGGLNLRRPPGSIPVDFFAKFPRFELLYLTRNSGFSSSPLSTFSGIQFAGSIAEALAELLASTYAQLSPQEARSALAEAPQELRLAVLSGAIDILPPQEILARLEELRNRPTAEFVAATELLSRVSGPDYIRFLAQMSETAEDDVAAAALRTLAANPSEQAAETILRLWNSSSASPNYRRKLVVACLDSEDDRWDGLLEAAVYEVLARYESAAPPTDEGAAEGNSASEPTRDWLAPAIRALPRRMQTAIVRYSAQFFRKITHIPTQDLLVALMLEDPENSYQELIQQWIPGRLAEMEFPPVVRNAIARYPTPELFGILQESLVNQDESTGYRLSLLRTTLSCATTDQLLEIRSLLPELTDPMATAVLQHLCRLDFPGWDEDARTLLRSRPNARSGLAQVLRSQGSARALGAMTEVTLELMEELTKAELPASREDASNADRSSLERIQQLSALLRSITTFSHPDARRIVNRCIYHPAPLIRQLGEEQVRTFLRRTPAITALVDASGSKRSGNYSEALDAVETALTLDPYCPDAYLIRSSLRLRTGDLTGARSDLVEADRLSPDDLATLNTLALVDVREGLVTAGIQRAEELLAVRPDDESNLYNTACVYSRAAEQSLGILKDKYQKRAIELLTAAVDAGFDDPDHLEADPDLTSLHQQQEWDPLFRRVQAAKEENEDQPQE